jgi:hypothetical protein
MVLENKYEVIQMTKHFKKVNNFDTARFMQELEREMIEEEEGDIFTLTGLERARDNDEISDAEDGFISGYLEA